MGFFSWKTSDTKKSISNIYSVRGAFPVYVLCPDGGIIEEKVYEGYGDFGGRDIYALLAEWNAPEECYDEDGYIMPDEVIRDIGIKLEFSDQKLKYPIKIVEDPTLNYDEVEPSEHCEHQGFFY